MTTKLTQSYAILQFYKNLRPDFDLPEGVSIMNPFSSKDSRKLAEIFYDKFYTDTAPRKLIFGINPGRFGGGVTGIPFTDPIRLANDCGISNDLPKKAELSSEFIYRVVDRYGGAKAFYRDFLITALSPLGFTRNGVNMNYYDDRSLLKSSEPFIVKSILDQKKQLITDKNSCYCLGEGTNYKIFQRLNEQHHFFDHIIALPHPRWVMQYRRKRVDEFVELYIKNLAV